MFHPKLGGPEQSDHRNGDSSMFFPYGIGTFHFHKKNRFKDFASEMPSQMMVHVRTDLDVIPLPLKNQDRWVAWWLSQHHLGYLKQVMLTCLTLPILAWFKAEAWPPIS